MRSLVISALFTASLMALSAAPASAGRGDWNCTGASYVCGSARTEAAKARSANTYRQARRHARWSEDNGRFEQRSRRSASAERRASRRAATTERRANRRQASASRSYSGGGGSGIASYYWQGQRVASGGRFNPDGLTAAHRTLPFGTRVRVTNLSNGRSVTVTINDRGPFIKGRIIDLSRGAARQIGMTGAGLARVSLSVGG